MNANELKCLLIDYLLINYQDSLLIGSEVPYISGKRWVDILLITKERELIAFEIKSDIDTFNRLDGQIKDAVKTFNQVYLVSSSKIKLNKIYSSIPKNVGYLLIDEEAQIAVRKATMRKLLSKDNLSHFLWKTDIKKILKEQSNTSVEIMRKKLVEKITLTEMKKLVCQAPIL